MGWASDGSLEAKIVALRGMKSQEAAEEYCDNGQEMSRESAVRFLEMSRIAFWERAPKHVGILAANKFQAVPVVLVGGVGRPIECSLSKIRRTGRS
jgi:hypothetical protein